MTQFVHRLFITLYFLIILITTGILVYVGLSFYNLPIEERFYHPQYELLKPSGLWGHGLGVIGTLIIIIGLFSYMARKRLHIFSRVGVLKYWLEFHIFMCTLGPVMVLFHTSFKFGGIVSVGFWSMAIVWASGVIGRFIYLQIPRTIEGRELDLIEVQEIKNNVDAELLEKYDIDFSEIKTGNLLKTKLKIVSKNISKIDLNKVRRLIRNQRILVYRIERLERMQRLFKYWHVAHLPFALIMLLIMVIHVIVVLTFGYKWIF
ncbi:MAG: hypothetical protein GZ091_11650 [Paludibacter sp.]|nr:hypothetical protein [Paludibacter sp.]